MPKHPPFKYGRGRCIFCEEFGVSKEHVFAEWLREPFPRNETTTHTKGIVEWPSPALPNGPRTITQQGQGHSGSKKVKVVCRKCNETWLSNRIEDAARPVLLPLIVGRAGTLTPAMLRIIATWAVKTTMTGEHINRKPVVQQHERTWLMQNLMPPPGWFVSIAPYSGKEWRDLGMFQHTGKLEVPSDDGCATEHNLGLAFIGMGHLFLIVRHSTWPRLWRHLGFDIPNVTSIRPATQAIEWPPPYVLSDIEAEYLTTYLARVFNERV